jgi:hypothetical protein
MFWKKPVKDEPDPAREAEQKTESEEAEEKIGLAIQYLQEHGNNITFRGVFALLGSIRVRLGIKLVTIIGPIVLVVSGGLAYVPELWHNAMSGRLSAALEDYKPNAGPPDVESKLLQIIFSDAIRPLASRAGQREKKPVYLWSRLNPLKSEISSSRLKVTVEGAVKTKIWCIIEHSQKQSSEVRYKGGESSVTFELPQLDKDSIIIVLATAFFPEGTEITSDAKNKLRLEEES